MDETLINIYNVSAGEDITLLKYKLKEVFSSYDFEDYEQEEIILSAIELGTNLINHTSGGIIKIFNISAGNRNGIKLVSEDYGPGIKNIDLALKDGYSTSHSLGYGLGSINRMMDELNISSDNGKTIIAAYKLESGGKSEVTNVPVNYSMATRKHPKMNVNGDACFIKKWDHYFLAAVIDGLGHGQFAHRASQSAKAYIENHYELNMDTMFIGISRACRATRGVVISIVKIDFESGELQHSGIGNIETRIIENGAQKKLITKRGIVGNKTITPRIDKISWNEAKSVYMFSDGISSSWNFSDLKNIIEKDPAKIAGYIIKKYSKYDDDATVVVIQGEDK